MESVICAVSPLPGVGGTGGMGSSCRHESTSGKNNKTDSRLRNGMMIELLGIIYCFYDLYFMIERCAFCVVTLLPVLRYGFPIP